MSDQKNGSKLQIVAVLSAVEILGMAGFATFPALLPVFVAEWSLSNTEAGWVSGIFYAGAFAAIKTAAASDPTEARLKLHLQPASALTSPDMKYEMLAPILNDEV